MLPEKDELPSKVLQMETPYVFLSGFMNFQDNTFSTKVIYGFLYCKQNSRRLGKIF